MFKNEEVVLMFNGHVGQLRFGVRVYLTQKCSITLKNHHAHVGQLRFGVRVYLTQKCSITLKNY